MISMIPIMDPPAITPAQRVSWLSMKTSFISDLFLPTLRSITQKIKLPSAMAQYTFANGVMGHIWMTYELPHGALGTRARYLVIGSKGMLDVHAYGQVKRSRADGNWDIAYQSADFKGPDAGWGYPSPYMRQAFARQIQALTDAIADGKPMDVSGIDGLRAVEMAEAAKRSAATGESVPIPKPVSLVFTGR